MKRVWLSITMFCLFSTTGCFVSESDYQKAVAARDELQKELSDTKEENNVLNQSITAIYKERDALLRQLDDCRTKLAAKDGTAKPDDKKTTDPGRTTTDSGRTTADVPRASKTIHEVQSGETLSMIARQYGVSMEALRTLNKIEGDILWVGQKLRIPEEQR